MKRLLFRESREQPLLLMFEDLHWIDSETQALLDSLVESLGSAHLLLLVITAPTVSRREESSTIGAGPTTRWAERVCCSSGSTRRGV